MKCAIISVSSTGAKLGASLAQRLSAEVTLYERCERASGAPAIYFTRTAALTAEIFSRFDVLLYIMATGIVVRAIAPLLQSKATDPAVVVMDEAGRHVISLLSGHLGGANEWTEEIARCCGADPVITTATDVHGKPAPDVLARHLCGRVEPLAALKPVNSAVAAGENVAYFLDERMPLAEEIKKRATVDGIALQPWKKLGEESSAALVLVSDREKESVGVPHVWIRPPTLVVGIGCRRGTSEALIRDAVEAACRSCGRSPLSIGIFVSTKVKADETGLLALTESYRREIIFYSVDELRSAVEKYHLEESAFVKKTIGVGNICEAAVLLKTGQTRLILPKTKYEKVTVAIGEAASLLSAWAPDMRRK